MSKRKQKRFTYTPSQKFPKLGKIKTEWDLKKLYYTSEKDPRIEKDLRKSERAYQAFTKKYKNKQFTSSVAHLRKAIEDYVGLLDLPASRAAYYYMYRVELNAADNTAERALNRLEERLTALHNQVLFFELAIAKVPSKKRRDLLSDPDLAPYRFYLEGIFRSSKFWLTEPEEKILNLKANTSRGLWVAGTSKILNKQTISFKGKDIPINGALMQFENLPHKDRHLMWNRITDVLEAHGEIAENELTALVFDKKTNDELRGFTKPYSSTTLSYDSTDKTLETLVRCVEKKGYPLSKRFYKAKKRILEKELTYIDRNEDIGEPISIPFDESIGIVRDVFYGFNPIYGDIFDRMLKGGQLDVWPKQGKGGGAFCNGGTNQPTMVFLNHNDSVDALRTIAHEMGHAIHGERSKRQGALYDGHSVLTAETASTFFEGLVTEHLLAYVPDARKLSFLGSLISDKISTMIMCIARFNFELEMHQTIRKEGGMSWKEMAKGLSRHFSAYTGPAIESDYKDGLLVITKPHYRMNFYQYSYSFGEIASSIMRKRYRDGSITTKDVDRFLAAGEKDSVENIFKDIGINMSKEHTFVEGLALLEEYIEEFERLSKGR